MTDQPACAVKLDICDLCHKSFAVEASGTIIEWGPEVLPGFPEMKLYCPRCAPFRPEKQVRPR